MIWALELQQYAADNPVPLLEFKLSHYPMVNAPVLAAHARGDAKVWIVDIDHPASEFLSAG